MTDDKLADLEKQYSEMKFPEFQGEDKETHEKYIKEFEDAIVAKDLEKAEKALASLEDTKVTASADSEKKEEKNEEESKTEEVASTTSNESTSEPARSKITPSTNSESTSISGSVSSSSSSSSSQTYTPPAVQEESVSISGSVSKQETPTPQPQPVVETQQPVVETPAPQPSGEHDANFKAQYKQGVIDGILQYGGVYTPGHRTGAEQGRGATPADDPYGEGQMTSIIISGGVQAGAPFDVEVWWDWEHIGTTCYY